MFYKRCEDYYCFLPESKTPRKALVIILGSSDIYVHPSNGKWHESEMADSGFRALDVEEAKEFWGEFGEQIMEILDGI